MKQYCYRKWKLFGVLLLTSVLVSAVVETFPGLRGMESQLVQVHAASACVTPPAGFNPLTASADQLYLYGLPPRPSIHGAREALWENLVKGAKKRLCQSTPTQQRSPTLPVPASVAGMSFSALRIELYDPYRSGYQADDVNIVQAYGEFNVVCTGSSGLAAHASAASVVGIGDAGLLEVGVTQQPYHQFFYTLGSSTIMTVTQYSPACPDHIIADVEYDPIATRSYVIIEDTKQQNYYEHDASYTPYQGLAYWNEMRFQAQDSLYNYGTVTWTAAEYAIASGSLQSLAGKNVEPVFMNAEGNYDLSSPGALGIGSDSSGNTASTFVDYWNAGN